MATTPAPSVARQFRTQYLIRPQAAWTPASAGVQGRRMATTPALTRIAERREDRSL